MRTNKKTFASAGSGVQAVLKSSELMSALRPHLAKVRWAEVVGPQVAGVTQVEKVQNGTELVVRVKNSVWANELTLLKGDMLRRLNLALGGQVLTEIRFKASGLAKDTVPKETPAPLYVPSPEELLRVMLSPQDISRIEETARKVTDDALRERVRGSLLRAARMDVWRRTQGFQPCARCGTQMPPSEASLCPLCRVGPANSTAARPAKESAP